MQLNMQEEASNSFGARKLPNSSFEASWRYRKY